MGSLKDPCLCPYINSADTIAWYTTHLFPPTKYHYSKEQIPQTAKNAKIYSFLHAVKNTVADLK